MIVGKTAFPQVQILQRIKVHESIVFIKKLQRLFISPEAPINSIARINFSLF